MEPDFSDLIQTLRRATDPSEESINAHREQVKHYVSLAATTWDSCSSKDLPNPWADITDAHLGRLSISAGQLLTRLLDGSEVSVSLLEPLLVACSAVAPMSVGIESGHDLDTALQSASKLAKQKVHSVSAIAQKAEQQAEKMNRHLVSHLYDLHILSKLLPNIPRDDLPGEIVARLNSFASWLPGEYTIATLDRRFSEVFSHDRDLSLLAEEVLDDVRSEKHDRGLSWGIASDWDRKVTLYKAMLRQLTSKSSRRECSKGREMSLLVSAPYITRH